MGTSHPQKKLTTTGPLLMRSESLIKPPRLHRSLNRGAVAPPAPINDKGAKPLYICAAVHPGRREAGEETLNERLGAVVNCGPVFCQTKS
jgi:hypothetical protein